MKQTLGWILIAIYWFLSLAGAITYSHLGQILGLIFVPVVTIPLQVIGSFYGGFTEGMLNLAWVGVSIFLLTRED